MIKNGLNQPLCFCGYHMDDAALVNVASGGLATSIAENIVSKGGVVYGVIHSEAFHGAEYTRAEKIADLLPIRGSKYVDVKPVCEGKSVYEMVLADLQENRVVLFVGLPCMVAAMVRRAEKAMVAENLITLDLICHGPTSPLVAKEYAEMMAQKHGSKVTDLTVRYRKNGKWTPRYHMQMEVLQWNRLLRQSMVLRSVFWLPIDAIHVNSKGVTICQILRLGIIGG